MTLYMYTKTNNNNIMDALYNNLIFLLKVTAKRTQNERSVSLGECGL